MFIYRSVVCCIRRGDEFPGCVDYGLCDYSEVNCCPSGFALWTSYEFRVSSGAGGAISTSGPVAVDIRDTAFRTNEAPKGASLEITSAAWVGPG